MTSWYAIRARGTGAEVAIYDEIGAYGVSAKGFLAELGALPDGTPVDLRLNSPGGSVFDAVAIYNALKRHEGTVTVWIDGIAASAASYIAMAGDEIVMPENAFLMIHDPSGLAMGTAGDMRAMAEALDKIAGSLVRGYAAKSGKPDDEIAALMAAETWFDAGDAVAAGFADRLADPVRMAARFDIGRFRNAPPDLVEAVARHWPGGCSDRGGGRSGRKRPRNRHGRAPRDSTASWTTMSNLTTAPARRTATMRPSSPRGKLRPTTCPALRIRSRLRGAHRPIPPRSAPRRSPMPALSSIFAALQASHRWLGGSSNRTPVSTTCAWPFWRQKPRPNPKSPPITRNPAGPRQPVPGARSSPAPSS